MDPITIGGIVLGVGAILVAALAEGMELSHLLAPTAFLIISGGTTGATIACFTIPQIIATLGNMKLLMKKPGFNHKEIIDMFVEMATIARKEGILALESHKLKVDHPFLQRGLRLVVDGTNPELVKQMLLTEITVDEETIKTASAVFQTAGGFAPTMGIIGTVIGLIHVLGNLSDPGSLGPAIAMAFIATLYGVASANLIFLPIAKKFGTIAKEEATAREMMLEGVLSIYGGDSPHIIGQKLLSFIDQKGRSHAKAA